MLGKVINLKDKPRPETYVYIGRRQWSGKELFEASPWANYFSVQRYGREDAIRRYEEKILNTPELLARLPELEGKDLACWCAPEACHGDVLLKLIEERSKDMSLLTRTDRDAELRRAIREHARTQEGYDSRLYDLWDEWNEEFFGGILVPPLVQLTTPGTTQCYGDCSPYSGLAGIKSHIRLRRSVLQGKVLELKHGNRNPKGIKRFMEDVLLHEMIHQFHQEITKENDSNYNGHGQAFSAKANEIGEKLGLPPARKTNRERDGKEPSPSQWPHNVRPEGYYLGAYVPVNRDVPEELRTIVSGLVKTPGAEHVAFMVYLMKAHGYGKVSRALKEVEGSSGLGVRTP